MSPRGIGAIYQARRGVGRMIVSFSYTTPALAAGRKDTTRRKWNDEYAQRVAARCPFTADAWDFSPRVGPARARQGLSKPRKVGVIRIVSVTKEDIATMPDSDFEREGFAYLKEAGLTIWDEDPREAFQAWRADGGDWWVVRFEWLGRDGGRDAASKAEATGVPTPAPLVPQAPEPD